MKLGFLISVKLYPVTIPIPETSMKQWKVILFPVVLAYLTILGGFLLAQRSLIFHPVPLNGTTPAQFHLVAGKDYHDVSFTSADGVTLTGWWIDHQDPGSNRPFLLYCHGNGDCLSQLAEVSKLFYNFGFNALIFDYRDYGASGKGPLSEKAFDGDALAAYRWVQNKGVPENRILIWGHSLGSSVAAWLATQTHPAGLILEGAFPSTLAVSYKRYPWLLVLPFMIQDPFDTEIYVQKRTCPLLQFHAERDTIIPIDLGERVYSKAVEPKQFVVVKDTDHNDFPSVAEQYKDVVVGFTNRCLQQAPSH